MSRPPLRVVLFDLDDTLHDDTAAYRRAAERVAEDVARERGADAVTIAAAYVRQAESFWKNLAPEHLKTPLVGVRVSMWRAALADVGIDDAALAERAARDYNRYRPNHLRLWPGALELLASLRARGLRLGLVTNGFSETHREKVELLGLEDAFDELFIADELGMLKPDPRVFTLACERLGAGASEGAMVGDRYDRDISGAAEAGLFTVWLNVRDESMPAGGVAPDAIVARLDQVEGALPLSRNRSLPE